MNRYLPFLLLALQVTQVIAAPPKIVRVTQKPSLPAFQFGPTVALSHKFLAVGSPVGPGVGNVATGRVDIHDAVSGKFLRALMPADGLVNDGFGYSLAIQGDILLVGAPLHQSGRGAVYTYNASTGKLLSKFMHPTVFDAEIGRSVALEGRFAASGGTAFNLDQGTVAVFSPTANILLQELVASDGVADDQFGVSVAINSGIVIVGATQRDALPGPIANAGAIYTFDAETGVEAFKFVATAPVANERLGADLAVAGDLILAGTEGPNPGAAYVFSIQSSGQIRRIVAPANITQGFGRTVATFGHLAIISGTNLGGGGMAYYDIKTGALLSTYTTGWEAGRGMATCNNRLAASVVLDGDGLAPNAFGSVHIISPISSTEPLEHRALAGDPLFGRVGKIGTIKEAYNNPVSGTTFLAGQTGPGLTSATTGIWRFTGNFHTPVAFSKHQIESAPDVLVGTMSGMLANQPNSYIFKSTLTGAPINSTNNQGVAVAMPSLLDPLFMLRQSGDPVDGGATGLIQSFTQIVQSYHATGDVAMTVKLKQGPNNIAADNDSALLITDQSNPNASLGIVTEGNLEPGANPAILGQISPFVAYPDQVAIFTAGRVGVDTAFNTGLYTLTNAGVKSRIMVKSDIVPGLANPATASAFLGVGATTTGQVLLRVTLGSPATAVNNELLMHTGFPALNDVLRKGADHPDIVPTVQWKRFLSAHTCPLDQAIFHAQLQGNGVTPANDGIVCLIQSDGTLLTLMREGDAIPGGDGARIGSILKIDNLSNVNSGHYLILCSLTGGPPSANLALFTGEASSGNPSSQRVQRKPFLRLRKGQLVNNSISTANTIRSISLPGTNLDTTGVGAKGLSHWIGDDGSIVFQVEWDNKVTQLVNADWQ